MVLLVSSYMLRIVFEIAIGFDKKVGCQKPRFHLDGEGYQDNSCSCFRV